MPKNRDLEEDIEHIVQESQGGQVALSSDREFADAVRDALSKIGHEGRFGNKVFLSDIWKFVSRNPRFRQMTVADFRKALLHANRLHYLTLARADLAGAMDPQRMQDSEMTDRGSTFHFVLDEEAEIGGAPRRRLGHDFVTPMTRVPVVESKSGQAKKAPRAATRRTPEGKASAARAATSSSPPDDREIVQALQKAISNVGPEGRFGPKVFISEIWHLLSRDPRFRSMDLDSFKRALLRLNQARAINLMRVDMMLPQHERRARESLIADRGATFHAVQDPRGMDPASW